MFGRAVTILAVCALALPALRADDAFVGQWKFNKDKSDVKGQTESIASLGNNKYKFTYGTISFDITADGTDQTSLPGATWALTILDANKWQVVSKSNGITNGTEIWTLAPDGKSISSEYKGTRPDGTEFDSHAKMTRVSGSGGFAGTWLIADLSFSDPSPVVIAAYGSGGLSVSYPADKMSMNLTMDGKDCPVEGPTVLKGSTTSAKRAGPRSIKLTDKLNGKLMDTTELKVSADGKTLTMTEHDAGVKKPLVLVYDRQ